MANAGKEYIVEEISKRLKDSGDIFLSDFTNLKSEEFNRLRNKLAENSSAYFIVKNTLSKLALKKAKINDLISLIDGPTGFVICGKDPVSISKILIDFSRETKKLAVKGGYVEGAVITGEEVKKLASLPSRKELLGALTGSINFPISSFVGTLGQLLRGLVVVIDQIHKKKKEEKLQEA